MKKAATQKKAVSAWKWIEPSHEISHYLCARCVAKYAAGICFTMEDQPVSADTNQLPKNGHPKTIQLSSNATLFWRVFTPVFGTVFFSGLMLVFWLTDEEELYLPVNVWWPRAITLIWWAAWILIVRNTLWKLKRIDVDDTHFYVTNYWTTLRYPWQDVARIEEKKRLGRRIVHFILKAPGRFGDVLSFLPGSSYDTWKEERGKTL